MIGFNEVMNTLGVGGLVTIAVFASRSLRSLGRIEAEFRQVREDVAIAKLDISSTKLTVIEQGKAIARIEGRLNGER